jgi:hypothetical protein
MSMLEHIKQGLKRTIFCRDVIIWLYLINLTLVLVPTFLLFEEIEGSLADRVVAESMTKSYDDIWFKEFSAEAQGLASTFDPRVTGIGAILNSFDDHISGRLFTRYLPIVALAGLYALFWTFASGGLLRAFHKNRPPSFATFISDSGFFFGRFFRITALAALGYALLFGILKPGIEDLLDYFLREEIDERIVFVFTLVKYLLVALFLAALSMISDYTKIATVVENRHSILLAMLRSLRICLGKPLRVVGLYLTLTLLGLLLLLAYGVAAPGANQQTWPGIILALVLGQVYIVGRIWLRTLYLGSQFELFRELQDGDAW